MPTAGPVDASQRRRERGGGRTGRVMKPPGAPAKATGGSGTPEWTRGRGGGGTMKMEQLKNVVKKCAMSLRR